jgi:precorrin-6A/cobalt-precorrin-6A reductase
MILLLGGTSDTAPLAERLAQTGYDVLVSTATDVPLDTGSHPRIKRRKGPLTEDDLVALATNLGISAIVDATHPYAEEARENACKAAKRSCITYLTYIRLPAVSHKGEIIFARDHEEAARLAFSFGRPVFITTGSRNLAPYAAAAHKTGQKLAVRVLDTPASLSACREADIPIKNIVTGRGPFTLEQNLAIIRNFGIGVVVTKDSGDAGGVNAKIEAAKREGCVVVVVSRPEKPARDAFDDMNSLLKALIRKIPPSSDISS